MVPFNRFADVIEWIEKQAVGPVGILILVTGRAGISRWVLEFSKGKKMLRGYCYGNEL